MSNFTKGPWVADKTSRAIGPVSRESDQSYGMVIPVAWVEFDPEVEIQAANHQLIAAAPELLEALQEMVAIVKKHTYPQPDKPSSTWGRMEAAEAVIARALGQ
jgi:hypothetical protein